MNRSFHAVRCVLIALLCALAAAAPARTHAQSAKPLPKPSPTSAPTVEAAPEGADFAIGQHAYTFTYRNGKRVQKLKYLLYLPESYGKDPYATFPLVVFLHGSRELGPDIAKTAQRHPARPPRPRGGLPRHRRLAAVARLRLG